ncbi:mechanosensitive ion channel family protein [Desulfatitalea alkaliphila]|uniref:Mechanosensitive ion channel family protein n=1 Tax=Desulfatitalea alkaliphila TaxID=2929485 RepID=A0AA41R2G4_9BACT|nr:mechanosensitive ion channel family protein [Desulfatitalea alkaliphila]MCJ8500466.1 mechanosensitive ion channel family protein [Desulfatitalea alkaliphila]
METIQSLIADLNWEIFITTALRITIVLLFAFAGVKLIHHLLQRLERRLTKKSEREGEPPSESTKRIETIVRLIKQAAYLFLWLTVGLVILKEFGVEIAPIIASAGIAGLAIGFGAQNLVRDVISGFFIILENQIRVGDVAVVNGTGGLVEKINFRTIVLRDLGGVVHIFPNGTVSTLSNLTNEWSAFVFDIGVAYKENTDRVVEVMTSVGQTLMEDPAFAPLILEPPEIFGVDKFADSAVIIKGRIKTKPIRQWFVGREYLRRIKQAFDANNIEIPFPHRTVYFGQESNPFNIQLLDRQEMIQGLK